MVEFIGFNSSINLFNLCEHELINFPGEIDPESTEFNVESYNSAQKCGEVFLDGNHTINFICAICYKNYQQLEKFLRHLMHAHFTMTKEFTAAGTQWSLRDKDYQKDVNVVDDACNNIDVSMMEENESTMVVQLCTEEENLLVDIESSDTEGQRFDRESQFSNLHRPRDLEAKVSVKKKGKCNVSSNTDSETNEINFCEICGCFVRKKRFLDHLKTHKYGKRYACEFCDKKFVDKGNLNTHIHRHLGIKPHSCSVCEKAFHTTTELKLHMRVHTGERPFKCEECGKVFRCSAHLAGHIRMHRNERLYVCLKCDSRFNNREHLRGHEACHSEKRPFKCTLCESTFVRRVNLRSHMKIHADIKQYACVICSKDFTQQAELLSHMKIHRNENKSY